MRSDHSVAQYGSKEFLIFLSIIQIFSSNFWNTLPKIKSEWLSKNFSFRKVDSLKLIELSYIIVAVFSERSCLSKTSITLQIPNVVNNRKTNSFWPKYFCHKNMSFLRGRESKTKQQFSTFDIFIFFVSFFVHLFFVVGKLSIAFKINHKISKYRNRIFCFLTFPTWNYTLSKVKVV